MAKITFADKIDNRTLPGILDTNKIVADDINALKASINALYDMFANVRGVLQIKIGAADFSGPTYTNAALVGLNPMVDFNLYSNNGTGALIAHDETGNNGYQFNATTGVITVPGTTASDNYLIQILTPVTVL